MTENLDFRMILAKLFFVCTLLPLSFNQAHTLHIGQMQNIDTVGTVNRHTTSAGDKSHNLISRNRAAALTEMHSHIIKSLDHNSALGMLWHILLLILPNSRKHFLICQRNRMILAVFIVHTVYNLAFFQSSVSYGCQTGIPVMEPVFADNLSLIFRLIDFSEIDSLCLGIIVNQFLAVQNIFFF